MPLAKPLLSIPRHAMLIVLVAVGAALVSGVDTVEGLVRVFLFALVYTAVIWSGNIWILLAVRGRWPGAEQTARRITVQVITGTLFTVVAASALQYLLCYLLHIEKDPGAGVLGSIRVSLIMTYIVMAVTEAIYFFKLWREAHEQANALQEANLRAQLGRLKAELNPHFLFNNFNTLAAVIEEDPARAMRMVEALSRYYRYVLKGESHLLSTVGEELESLEAYSFLLKIRYEEAFQLKIHVSDACKGYHLPTLTLQTLAENATKHNAVTLARPLILEVSCTSDGLLEVRNNIVPRHGKAPGAGIGLSNLRERSRLLGLGALNYRETEAGYFVLHLPLLMSDPTQAKSQTSLPTSHADIAA